MIGRKITKVRWMTKEELDDHAWEGRAVILELDNGDEIHASSDDEGNSPGTLFGTSANGQDFYVFPEGPYPPKQ